MGVGHHDEDTFDHRTTGKVMSTSLMKRKRISHHPVGQAEGYAARNYNFVFSSDVRDWMCGVGYSYGVLKRKKRYEKETADPA